MELIRDDDDDFWKARPPDAYVIASVQYYNTSQ